MVSLENSSTLVTLAATSSENEHSRPAADSAVAAARGQLADIIEIRDPDIDLQQIIASIQQNSAIRKPLPPSAAALGRVRMAKRRKSIIASLKELKGRIRDYGVVESHRQGWLRVVDLFIKRTLRQVIRRHILQQHRIHLKLHTVLDQLINYLEADDISIRACIDQAERNCERSDPDANPNAAVPG
jgi:hypothetical protein